LALLLAVVVLLSSPLVSFVVSLAALLFVVSMAALLSVARISVLLPVLLVSFSSLPGAVEVAVILCDCWLVELVVWWLVL